MKSYVRFLPRLVLAAALLASTAFAAEKSEQGRAIAEKYRSAAVTVQLTVKMQMSLGGMGGEEQETKSEVVGTVISPEGLTVLSLSETDPMSMMGSMFGGMMDEMEVNSRVTDVKILQEDGSEIPARIVLRDKDLDLAFVRPLEKPAEPLACVDLQNAGAAQILDPLVALGRMGKVANRASSADFVAIRALVSRPRTYYVISMGASTLLGSPVFNLDGQILGVTVLRTIKGSSTNPMSGMAALFSGGGMIENMTPIVLPAPAILEVAAQAPGFGEAVAEEESPAEESPADESPAEEPAKEEDAGGVALTPEPAQSEPEQN